MNEINVDLLIEFISGENLLWVDNFPKNDKPWSGHSIKERYKWIDGIFQKKFLTHLINLSDENFKQALKFIRYTYFKEYQPCIKSDGAVLLVSLYIQDESFNSKLDSIFPHHP